MSNTLNDTIYLIRYYPTQGPLAGSECLDTETAPNVVRAISLFRQRKPYVSRFSIRMQAGWDRYECRDGGGYVRVHQAG